MSVSVIKKVFGRGLLWALLLALGGVSGCMVGPEYERPAIIDDGAESFANSPADWPKADDLAPVGRWWERFNDAVANELVDEALANNYDLKAAAARVVESRALYDAAWGRRVPQIDYAGSRTQGVILPGADITKTYAHGLTISWVADVFGKLRRANRATADDLLADEYGQQALIHSIISQALRSRVRVATAQRLVDIAESNTFSRQETLDIVERRYNSGLLDSSLSLHLAKENLAAAASTVPIAFETLGLSINAQDVLLGRRPGSSKASTDALGGIPEFAPIPLSIPASLLDRRPDVRSAEMQLAAATERIGVSIADMYPDLTFTATGGYRSDKYRLSTATENQIYSAIISLAAPIYKGGSLKAAVKASRARADQAAASYANTVLRAIQEVEDALVSELQTRKRVELVQERFDQANIADGLARQRYSQGLETLLIVLETERRKIIAENELALAIENLYNARIDLFLALGGDWQEDSNQPEVSANK